MLKGIVIGFLCFILFLFLHAVIFHTRKINLRFIALVKIFCALLPVYVILYLLIPVEAMIIMPADPAVTPGTVIGLSKVFNFFVGLLFYLLLFFGYCQFYFIIDRSISVRVMIEIEKAKDKKLTFDEIKQIYSLDYILSRRLKHMIDTHYITEENGVYKNILKGKNTARLFKFLKDFLRIGEGG